MKNKILFVFTLAFYLLAFSNSNGQSPLPSSDDFYDSVLDDYSMHSRFVLVDIKSDEYTGKAIIENGLLFNFLSKTRKFNQNQYKTFMKDLLLKKSELSLKKSDLNEWHFKKVKSIEAVENLAINGKNELIAHYFKCVEHKDFDVFVIKEGIDDDEEAVLIANLFKWKVAAWIDDETGYLVLQAN